MDKEEVSKAKLVEYAKKIIEAEKHKSVNPLEAVKEALKKDLGSTAFVLVSGTDEAFDISIVSRSIDHVTMDILKKVLDGYELTGIFPGTTTTISLRFNKIHKDC